MFELRKEIFIFSILLLVLSMMLASCYAQTPDQGSSAKTQVSAVKVLAVETFLADIAQNVAGDRLHVDSLIPIGVDPHAFEPAPRDVAKIAESQVLIINGAGFEKWLEETIQNAGGDYLMIEASAGLSPREALQDEEKRLHQHEIDPHFWLNPLNAIRYVENIRDGLIQADPGGATVYTRNAEAYMTELKDLDAWIEQQISRIPVERRLIVTNHESFGYFADRYGFKVIGTIIPSVSAGASPSARQMAQLVDHIRQAGVPAIFLETGSNPQLAEQIAQETGVRVIGELYTHSLSEPDGKAPTYLDMMKYNVRTIVEALK